MRGLPCDARVARETGGGVSWVTFALALGAFLLALGVYLSVRA